MPEFECECVVAAPIEQVWAWHEDVRTALPALSPPGDDVRLERLEGTGVGLVVEITARGPLGPLTGRIRWVATYVEYVPPHPVVMGLEARFVDEQLAGPFAFWRHSHEFEAVDAKTTRCLDRVQYRPPLWPLSYPADLLIIRPKLRGMFAHRHRRLKEIFG